ncbi:cell surface protein [Enterococcus thailandicus]|uniref:Cell surface protein n=2 Tax=root TaxID=1 RepID=A0A510WF53_ENTTH|nr:DUF916 and DUF3324 domain-containing protein [Enterococcus thailandicus]MDK4350841.1 DUF916 and DUF3324 domain-containing protein [Enterococcus thailandicus]MDT2733505.1 DUF916 and DUF3324 domain-containing protein [Enterococcus thailandicus]MDT2750498.1 DUF916 and DUF3324 domain-containing protein [Enterococcus thailandicus]MDT2775058.1 DUF916 and DUF3324 domain-containing protein [Enterococcus thailandicus]MEA4828696.1 DUF916 and DUF3324 domain-containing protein [Enterococcus thailandicu
MKNKVKAFLLCAISVGTFYSFQNVSASAVDFQVNPLPSEKQVDKSLSYYDLQLKPKEATELVVQVTNNANHPIVVDTNVDHASTNSNGVVEYKNSQQFEVANLTNDMKQLVKVQVDKIALKANETKELTYTITAPEKTFDGVVAGGINLIEEISKETQDSAANKSSMAVQNQYGYTIALILHGEKEITKPIVEAGKIKVEQINGRNSIKFPLKNTSAMFINKLNVKGDIRKADEEKVLYTTKIENGQQAPNSVYNFDIRTDGKELSPGKYTATLTAESKGEKWEFKQNFTISKKTAADLNKTAITKEEDHTMLYLILLVCGILLLLFIIIFIYIRKKNQKIKKLMNELQKEDSAS